MDANKLNLLLGIKDMEKTSSDNKLSDSGDSCGENVCSKAVKELLEHSVAAEVFGNILKIKDDQIKNGEDKVTELETKLSVLNLKIKEKDDLIDILSNGASSVKNVVDNLMESLTKYKQNSQQTDTQNFKVDQSNNNDVNEPIESTIKKLEETIAEWNIDVIEKDEKLAHLTQEVKKCNEDIRIPYGVKNPFMYIPNTPPFEIRLDSFGHIVIHQRSLENPPNLTRTLNDYSKGFTRFNDYWVGLKAIHKITNYQPYSLVITICGSNKYLSTQYNHFVVAGEDENYKLKSLGVCRGSGGDIMRPCENQEFRMCSTLNCGWWGVKNYRPLWNFKGQLSNVKFVIMKLKPRQKF